MSHKQRKLSEFMCQGMMLDYLEGRLEHQTREDFEESLEQFPELKQELEEMQRSIEYCQDLSSIELTEPYLEKFKNKRKSLWLQFENFIFGKGRKYIIWTLEGLALLALLVWGFRYFALDEWFIKKTQDPLITLMETEKPDSQINLDVKSDKIPEGAKTPSIALSAENKESEIVSGATSDVGGDESKASNLDSKKEKEKLKEVLLGSRDQLKKRLLDSGDEKEKEIKEEEAAATEKENEKKDSESGAVGYVYIATFWANDVKESAKWTRNQILSLGGRKAGRVRLGWIKLDGSRYFHFIIPKKDYEVFTKLLEERGRFEVNKLTHPKVMPENQVRFVMHIKEDKSLPAQVYENQGNIEEENSAPPINEEDIKSENPPPPEGEGEE